MRLSFISGAVLALAGLVSASNVVELDSKNFDEVSSLANGGLHLG